QNNILSNDILVDRLRDPEFPESVTFSNTLDVRLNDGNVVSIGHGGVDRSFFEAEIDGESGVGAWSDGDIGGLGLSVGANTGVTITTWASIRRPNDPNEGPIATRHEGKWPAYLIETKDGLETWAMGSSVALGTPERRTRATNIGADFANYGGAGFDATWPSGGDPANMGGEDFRATEPFRLSYDDFFDGTADPNQEDGLHSTFENFLLAQIDGSGALGAVAGILPGDNTYGVNRTITRAPFFKNGVVAGSIPTDLTVTPGPRDYEDIRPEPFPRQVDSEVAPVDDAGDDAVIRVGDLLTTMAIGPWYDPGFDDLTIPTPTTSAQQAARLQRLESAWTTLSEAMALSLHYQNRSVEDMDLAGNTIRDVFENVGGDVAGTVFPDNLPLLDRGHLVIDDFVPYVEGDGTIGFNAGELDQGSLGATDIVPPMNADLPTGLGIPLALELMDRFRGTEERVSGLTTRTQGLININTAPLAVLRTLPLLSPRVDNGVGDPEFWGGDNVLDEQPTGVIQTDIAAAIVAYRSMGPLPTRPLLGITIDENGPATMDFSEVNGFVATDETPWSFGSGIPGLREINAVNDRSSEAAYAQESPRFFRSLGELLAVRYEVETTPGMFDYSLHNITKLAENGVADAADDDVRAVIEGRGYPVDIPDGDDAIVDDYDEKIAIFNALSNVATVRSDVFAVWFVLHGYREADVTGLGQQDPMSPSFQRRYLMILDRSNVTRSGQRPRVLAFEELPL
ncbi:MAG: hypothetical protein AAGK04_13650, partial [Planctomycetota bacterium]